jgi:cytochrome c oxidase assembly protein subunit 15
MALSRRLPTLTPEAYRRVVFVALFFVAAIVLSGASVRLSGSGLGCPTWPRCTGDELVDISEPHRAVEQINRLFTGAVGVAVAVAFAGAFRRRPYRRDLAWFGAALIGGVLLQAIIGGIVVLLELQWQSVALHFLASFVLLYGTLELLRRAGEPGGARRMVVAPEIRTLSEVVFVLATAVLVFGTVVTGAGPHGGDEDVARLDWPLENAVRLHSVAAWVLVATTVLLIARARRAGEVATLQRAEALLAAMVLQGSLGYIQWFNRVPPVLVVFHVVGALLVFSLATWLRFAAFTPIGVIEHERSVAHDAGMAVGGAGVQ